MTDLRSLILLAACSLPIPALAVHTHVYGQAKLHVAVDGAGIAIHLDSRLDSLLGFEHPPYDSQQVKAAEAMVARLRAAQDLFVASPAANCKLTGVKIEAGAIPATLLAGGTAMPAKPGRQQADHDDLDADFNLRCARPEALHAIDVRLFDAFPRLRGVDVQMISPRGQTVQRVTPDQRMLAW